MKRTKLEKGITLIALIITIILLLILAVVTIGSIKDSNIVAYAQNASKDYETGKGKEQSVLSQYETLLEEQEGPWELQGNGKIINRKTGESTEIANTFTTNEVLKKLGIEEYKGTYEGVWTVLGVENGKLKLATTTNIVSGVKLGYEDPGAIQQVPVADENALTEEEKLARSVWSYNHAIETIEAIVETGTKRNARSKKYNNRRYRSKRCIKYN